MTTCWCGTAELAHFSPEYLQCPVCGSLVTAKPFTDRLVHVSDDDRGFYGRDYWLRHQEEDLGLPDIRSRARSDLPERCLHWLRTLLKYKLPPARVLELGSAHGGFVAVLKWAGYDARGLELSPWVVDFARRSFDVSVLLGPVEQQSIEPASLDAIALMDVLEHLPDPSGTIRHCLSLLKPDGLLLIQTPRVPEGRSYEELQAEGHPFLRMLQADEHLFLFTASAIRDIFASLGAAHVVFEQAIFAHYDMFLVASRAPLRTYAPAEAEEALEATPGGRLVQALLDLGDQRQDLAARYAESEHDRAQRLDQVNKLSTRLSESEAERSMQRELLEQQQAEIRRLQSELGELRQQLEAAEADRAARGAVIERQGQEIAWLQAEVHRWLEESKGAWQRVGELEAALESVRRTRVYRLLRRLGWSEPT